MARLKPTRLVLALLGALFIVGCGGGDDSVTKAEFIKRADLICRKADFIQGRDREPYIAKHEKELRKLSPKAAEEKLIKVLLLPTIRTQIEELESLRPPEGEERKVKAIFAGFKAAMRKGEKDPYWVERWDLPAKDPFSKINQIAVRYGFNDCRDLR